MSLISEMRCSCYITGGMGGKKISENALQCWVEPKHHLTKQNTHTQAHTCTYIHTYKLFFPPVGQNRKPTERALTNMPSFLQAPDASHQRRLFFYRQSTGKLLLCPSHDTLTERKVSINRWTAAGGCDFGEEGRLKDKREEIHGNISG